MNRSVVSPSASSLSESPLLPTKELVKQRLMTALVDQIWAEVGAPEDVVQQLLTRSDAFQARTKEIATTAKAHVVTAVEAEAKTQLQAEELAASIADTVIEQSDVVPLLAQKVKAIVVGRILETAMTEVQAELQQASSDQLWASVLNTTNGASNKPSPTPAQESVSSTAGEAEMAGKGAGHPEDPEASLGETVPDANAGDLAQASEQQNEETTFRHLSVVAPEPAQDDIQEEETAATETEGPVEAGAPETEEVASSRLVLVALLPQGNQQQIQTLRKEFGLVSREFTLVRAAKMVALVYARTEETPVLTEAEQTAWHTALRTLGTVIPFAEAPSFGSKEAVVAFMTEQEAHGHALFETLANRAEWHVSVRRNVEKVRQVVVETSDQVGLFVREMKQRPKGIAQFLKSKMVKAINKEIDVTTGNCLQHSFAAFDEVAEHGFQQLHEAGQGPGDELGRFVLLVDTEHVDKLKEVCQTMSQQYTNAGFHFQLTGPHVPYSFLQPATGTARQAA